MAIQKNRAEGTSDVRRILIFYGGFCSTFVALWVWLLGLTPEFKAFFFGLAIFTANLWLWIIVVRELLNSAANSSLILAEPLPDLRSADDSETPVPEALSGTDISNSTSESGNDSRAKGRQGLMVLGMVLKLALLGGGFYICLAVLKIQPIYFVSGFGAGLVFLAVAGYAIRD